MKPTEYEQEQINKQNMRRLFELTKPKIRKAKFKAYHDGYMRGYLDSEIGIKPKHNQDCNLGDAD